MIVKKLPQPKITNVTQSQFIATQPLNQRLHMLLCIFLCTIVGLSVTGCEKKIKNPLETLVPNTPEQQADWQGEIQKSYDMLSAEQQKTLSEYMLRKRLNAGDFTAEPITIGEAITAQQKFAKTHLNYRYFLDTKPKSADSKDKDGKQGSSGQRSKIVILPTYHFFAEHQTADKLQQADYFVDNNNLVIGLNNYGMTDIGTMIGTVTVYSVANDVKQTLNIPWTQFLPPLASGVSGMINVELPLQMEDADKLERLISAEDLQVVPDAIALYQANGKVISLGKYDDLQQAELQKANLQDAPQQQPDNTKQLSANSGNLTNSSNPTNSNNSSNSRNLDNMNQTNLPDEVNMNVAMAAKTTKATAHNPNEQIVYEKIVLQ